MSGVSVVGLPSLDVVHAWSRGRLAERIERSPHSDLFHRYVLFVLWTSDVSAFANPRLSRGNGSVGLCAYDGERLTSMSLLERDPPTKHEAERVLAGEGPYLFSADPLLVASLFADLFRDGNTVDIVLGAAADLGRDDRLDTTAYERVQAEIMPPQLHSSNLGWRLSFWSIRGWMNESRDLVCNEIHISPKFAVDWHDRIVAERIVGPDADVVF